MACKKLAIDFEENFGHKNQVWKAQATAFAFLRPNNVRSATATENG